MVGAEKSKQDQRYEARLAAKGDARDRAMSTVSGAHSAAVSVSRYRGPFFVDPDQAG